jgi:hypothetical protein
MRRCTSPSVTGILGTTDPYIVVTDEETQFGEIDFNETVVCEDSFVFQVSSDCPDEHVAVFWLILTVDPGALSFKIPISAPLLGVRYYEVDDSQGNNNGCADPGEHVNLRITLSNRGGDDAAHVTGILRSDDPYVSIHFGETSFGTIQPEEDVACITPLHIQIEQSCPVPYTIQCYLDVIGNAGHTQQIHTPISVGEGFADDMESSTFGWTHMAFSKGSIDEWHLSTKRNHTPGGSISWKCGAAVVGDYSDGLDAALISPPVTVGNMFWLTFWHRIDAETRSTPGDCWDGGVVMIDDGSDWTHIAPLYGYPYVFSESRNSPFEEGTPCFSGIQGWTEVEFDLSDYAGRAVRFMFRFGTDAYTTQEGWYIDDLTVEGKSFTLLDDFESEADRWDFGSGWRLSDYGYNNSTSITDSPKGDYENNADNSLTYLRTFDLSACSTAALTYWHWHSMEEDRDYGYVEASADGKSWTKQAQYTGHLDFPMHIGCVLVTDFCGQGGDSVRIRFRLVSDGAGTQDGWYLDTILFWYDRWPTVKGDVNCDEGLNVTDVLRVVNIIVNKGPHPSNFELWAADCNGGTGRCDGDGGIDVLDVIKMVRLILEFDECP